MVESTEEYDKVRIIDFGVARYLQDTGKPTEPKRNRSAVRNQPTRKSSRVADQKEREHAIIDVKLQEMEQANVVTEAAVLAF